jgi:hypothetical protein
MLAATLAALLELWHGHVVNSPSVPIPRLIAFVQLVVIAGVTALSFTFKKRPLNILDRIALLAFAASIYAGGDEATRQELPLALIVGGVCVLAAWAYDRLQRRRRNTPREKYTGKRDRKEARKFRDDFLNDLKNGTLLEQAEEWWNEFRKPRIAENTRNSERYRLQHLQRVLGNKRLREITNKDLDDYTTKRLAEGIGAWSITKEILLWSLILKKAKLWRRIADDYKPLKTRASDIGRALTRDELRQLAETAATDQDWEAAFYGSVLAVNTGLRGGEIKKLRIGELDL